MGVHAIQIDGREAARLHRLAIRADADRFLEALRTEYGRQLRGRGAKTNVRAISSATTNMREMRAEALRRSRNP